MKRFARLVPTHARAAGAVLVALAALSAGALFAPGRAEAATVNIAVGNPNWFCDMSYSGSSCPTTVAVGDTVTWNFPGGAYHTTTECRGSTCDDVSPPNPTALWDSGLRLGGSYSYVFTTPGVYYYACNFHGYALMRGEITVTVAVGGNTELPGVQFAPVAAPQAGAEDSSSVALVAGGAALALAAVVSVGWYARRRGQLD